MRRLFGPGRQEWETAPRGPAIVAAVGGAAFAATTAGIVAGIAINIAASLALSLLTSVAFGPKSPRQPEVKRDLARPNSLPPYRSVYGHTSAYGAPAPIRHPHEDDTDDSDGQLIGCLIFNSRPSEGNFTLVVDKREVTYTGDPYDFAGDGAVASGPGKLARDDDRDIDILKFWIGRGDQTAPPTWITDNYPNTFTTADGWQGRTTLWFHLYKHSTVDLMERWPHWPPEFEMIGDWSKVWDPSDEAQDPDDETTWTFSDNRALCVLDALRTNPLRPYPLSSIHLDSFEAAAAIDDEDVPLKAGGTEKRHRVAGVLVWSDQELHSQIEPLVMAGGARTDLVRIGGKLGLVPGDFPESAATITDILTDDGLDYQRLKPGRDLASRVSCSYVEPTHDWQLAALPVYEVPGAVDEDGGLPATEHLELDFVPSVGQAARLQKRHAWRLREQRRIAATLPPAAFDLVSGSGVTVALPAPWTRMNGAYQVRGIRPRLIEPDDDGVVLRCSAELVEVHAEGWAWDAATEEPDVPEGPEVETTPGAVRDPGALAVSSISRTTGGISVIGALLEWAPSASTVSRYETEYRPIGDDWQSGPDVGARVRDSSGDVFAEIVPLGAGTYDFRVRALGAGRVSEWIEATGVTIAAPDNQISAPTAGTVDSVTVNSITVRFTMPDEAGAAGIAFYDGAADDTGTMTLFATKYGSPGDTLSATRLALPASTTRWFAARTVDSAGGESAFSATVDGTTDSGGA